MCTKSLEECRLLVTYRNHIDGGTNSSEKTALWSPPSTKSWHYSSILLFSERRIGYTTRTLPITADRGVVTRYHQKKYRRVVGLGQVAFANCT